jgi:hypothetical protein
MELSPLAKEKLAKVGELSTEEKGKLKLSQELTFLLADYFTNKLSTDDLWSKLKKLKENGDESVVKETQTRLIAALNLGSNDMDFGRYRSGILGCETLKEQNKYAELELCLDSLESIRQQYRKEKETAFNSMRDGVQKQVEMAARQVAKQAGNQRVAIDVQGSVEASVRGSPQWKEFILKHEKTYGQKFDGYLIKLRRLI